MSPAARFWAAIAPSFLFVAGLAGWAEWSLRHGAEVRLEVRAYDPMDALSGRYLAVPLAIERLEWARFQGSAPLPERGEDVWVLLATGDPWWSATAILSAPPAPGDAPALHGTVVWETGGVVNLDCGLGRFYVSEDANDPTGRASGHKLTAVVRVAADGHGMLSDLLVDGESYARWNAAQPGKR